MPGVLHYLNAICHYHFTEHLWCIVWLYSKMYFILFRSYWVGSVSWSPGGLFLACVLKRGSLLMLARLGGLLTLASCGCNVDFGPAHFLPLHPLVTYRYTFNTFCLSWSPCWFACVYVLYSEFSYLNLSILSLPWYQRESQTKAFVFSSHNYFIIKVDS